MFSLALTGIIAQQISPYLIGNNVWLPPWMGGTKWNELKDDIGDAGFQLIRIGGNGAQSASAYTNVRIADLVEEIRNQGAEVIVQVPYTHSAQATTDMITYINGTRGLGVKYWAIGNEPNHQPMLSVSTVAEYIRRIATALKAYDATIKTMGPTTAWYDASYFNPLFVNKGADDISGVDANGNYYIDVLTWNKYQLTYGLEYNGTITSAVNLVNSQNASRPEGKKMQWAILELNGHYSNDLATDAQKCWSFNTGQTFAELFDIGMRRGALTIAGWSIYEGGGNRSNGDLGLFDGLAENYGNAVRGRSTYYHSLMLGLHMKGNYLPNVHNGPSVNGANNGITVSSMGDAEGLSVMIINRSATLGYEYNIGLNNVYGSTATLRIRVAAGLDKEFSGHIDEKTTQMLVFDSQGNLTRKYSYNEQHSENYCGPEITDYSSASSAEGVLNFISPINGTKFKTNQKLEVAIEASHSAGIESVELYIEDELVGSLSEASYEWDYTNEKLADLVAGFYELRAVCKIVGGGSISKTITFANALSFAPEDPIQIPGKVEAEFFDDMLGIQTQETADDGAGLNVGWIDAGDWLDYIIDVQEDGLYVVTFRVAGWTNDGRIALRNAAGTTLTGANIPNAGALQYQAWGTVSGEASFTLEAGVQVIRIFAEGSPFNFNYFTINKDAVSSDKQMELGSLKAYPQPCKEVLHIEGAARFHNFRIYNQMGQVVRELTNSQGDRKTLEMSGLEPGLYFIKLSGDNEGAVLKIAKE